MKNIFYLNETFFNRISFVVYCLCVIALYLNAFAIDLIIHRIVCYLFVYNVFIYVIKII